MTRSLKVCCFSILKSGPLCPEYGGEAYSHPISPAGELAKGGCQSIAGFLEMTHGGKKTLCN